jgi:hypothetical protein
MHPQRGPPAPIYSRSSKPLPLTPKREALEHEISLVPPRKGKQATRVQDHMLTGLSPVHLQELWDEWKSENRVPTVASRRAWAAARKVSPHHVHSWFSRRKTQANKAGRTLAEGTYVLSVGSPPEARDFVAVKKEPWPETPAEKKRKTWHTGRVSNLLTPPFTVTGPFAIDSPGITSFPDLTFSPLMSLPLNRRSGRAYTQLLSETDGYAPTSPFHMKNPGRDLPMPISLHEHVPPAQPRANVLSVPESSPPSSSPSIPVSDYDHCATWSRSTARTTPEFTAVKNGDFHEGSVNIAANTLHDAPISILVKDQKSTGTGASPLPLFSASDLHLNPVLPLDIQVNLSDVTSLGRLCNQGVASRSDFRCDLCETGGNEASDLSEPKRLRLIPSDSSCSEAARFLDRIHLKAVSSSHIRGFDDTMFAPATKNESSMAPHYSSSTKAGSSSSADAHADDPPGSLLYRTARVWSHYHLAHIRNTDMELSAIPFLDCSPALIRNEDGVSCCNTLC